MKKRVIITGVTGYIGRMLAQKLSSAGYEVVGLTRGASGTIVGGITMVRWDAVSHERWQAYANGAYAIINLAGDNIASGIWTSSKKKLIRRSRLNAGKAVIEAIQLAHVRPKVLIQASAMGYYGSRGDDILDENSPPGDDFLAHVCRDWEDSVRQAEDLGVRVAVIRTAPVIGKNGGLMDKAVLPFKLYLGGYPGTGRQWFPWIHIDDEVRAIEFLLKRNDLSGPFNLTSENPVPFREFAETTASILKKPSWLRIPALAVRIFGGEMGKAFLLSSQRGFPKRLIDAGFTFSYPGIRESLESSLVNTAFKN